MALHSRVYARINLDHLAENWRQLDRLSGQADAAAVIKANAYGMGMKAVALALWQAGCRFFFTATTEEAIAVRAVLPEARIGIFDTINPADRAAVLEYRLLPSVSTACCLELLQQWQGETGEKIPALLQVDTGMNRLGASVDTALTLVQSPGFSEAAAWQLVYSHLSSADEADPQYCLQQKAQFDQIRAYLPDTPASIGATAAIMRGPGFHYQLTRPGIALYGIPLVPSLGPELKPVLSLHARILQIREARPGQTVGYNRTTTLSRPSRLATLAAGYADGVSRQLSNKGQVHLNGWTAPITGRVSMDTTVVDITDWPDDLCQPGDEVDLLHEGYTAEDMAHDAETISHDVLTALGARVARVYAGGILSQIDL